MTSDRYKSAEHGETFAPPGFSVKKYRVLVSFVDEDNTPVWSEIMVAEHMDVDYSGHEIPIMTLEIPLVSQVDPARAKVTPPKLKPGGLTQIGTSGTITITNNSTGGTTSVTPLLGPILGRLES